MSGRKIMTLLVVVLVSVLVAGCGAPVQESVESSPMGIALERLMGRSLMDRDPAYDQILKE